MTTRWRWYALGYQAGVMGYRTPLAMNANSNRTSDRWFFRGFVAGVVAQQYGVHLLPRKEDMQ